MSLLRCINKQFRLPTRSVFTSFYSKMSKKALVLLGEGAEEMETVISIDVLRRAGFRVTVAGIRDLSQVECSRGVKIVPDVPLSKVDGLSDVIIMPGGLGGTKEMIESEEVGKLLKEQEKSGRIIAAICAGSTIKWGKGDVAIKNIAKKIQLEHPETISSNKLRKQIATVMQILSMTKDESKQFANFMGHTQKTHDEFYELPVDIYQTAKVSKLLLLMERGTVPVEYKGKSLREINLDVNEEYAEEDKDDEENTGLDNSEGATDGVSRNVEVPSYNENSGSADEQKSWRKSSQTVSEESEDEIPKKKMKSKKPVPRKGWSDEEIKLLKKTFMSHIRKRSYPSGEQIKDFLKDAKINRSVAVVKSKIQHLMKLQ